MQHDEPLNMLTIDQNAYPLLEGNEEYKKIKLFHERALVYFLKSLNLICNKLNKNSIYEDIQSGVINIAVTIGAAKVVSQFNLFEDEKANAVFSGAAGLTAGLMASAVNYYKNREAKKCEKFVTFFSAIDADNAKTVLCVIEAFAIHFQKMIVNLIPGEKGIDKLAETLIDSFIWFGEKHSNALNSILMTLPLTQQRATYLVAEICHEHDNPHLFSRQKAKKFFKKERSFMLLTGKRISLKSYLASAPSVNETGLLHYDNKKTKKTFARFQRDVYTQNVATDNTKDTIDSDATSSQMPSTMHTVQLVSNSKLIPSVDNTVYQQIKSSLYDQTAGRLTGMYYFFADPKKTMANLKAACVNPKAIWQAYGDGFKNEPVRYGTNLAINLIVPISVIGAAASGAAAGSTFAGVPDSLISATTAINASSANAASQLTSAIGNNAPYIVNASTQQDVDTVLAGYPELEAFDDSASSDEESVTTAGFFSGSDESVADDLHMIMCKRPV